MPLDADFFKTKARDELRETDARKAQSLQQFREWFTKNPYIKNPDNLDDVLLLALLRTRKYSMDKVFESAEKLALIFAEYTDWFDLRPENLERALHYLDEGVGVILKERDEFGRRVTIVRAERPGELRCPVPDVMRMIILATFFMLLEEETQICGVHIILDFTRLTKENMLPMPMKTIVSLVQMVRMVPVRIKQIDVVGISGFLVAIYDVVKGFFSEKIRNRVHFHTEFEIPSYTSEQIVDGRAVVEEKRETIERLLQIDVDRELLKKYGKDVESVGSFRTLEID